MTITFESHITPIPTPGSIFRRLLCLLTGCEGAAERKMRFERMVNDYGDLITRITLAYADSRDCMQDLRQDILINLWKGMDSFRGDSAPSTWIYRVALNTCVSTIRKRSRQPLPTLFVDSDGLEVTDDAGEDDVWQERIEALHAVISSLSAVDRAIVTMRLDGCTYEEIAQVTGVSRSNVAVRLHRFKQKCARDID